jgi:serine/threonine-protein kinase
VSDPFQIVGTTIAEKYRVDRVLGEGGYGVVYAGHQMLLGAEVAIKLLKPIAGAYAGEAQATQQFLREARVLFSLNHPAIVRMYDVGDLNTRLGSVPYVVLELLAGVGLDEEMARRRRERAAPFTMAELVAVFEPVLEGLAFAHQRGVVHRDLKPSNVMLVPTATRARTAKILDFGTARTGGQEVSMGTTGFTPRYASPEQWDPAFGSTGPASDLFSLGLILAEACTLEPVFPGTSPGQILAQAVNPNHVVSVRQRRPDLPEALDHVIARATRRPMHERFTSAGEMLEALRSAASQSAGGQLAPSAPSYPSVTQSQQAWTGPRPSIASPAAPPSSSSSSAGWMALGAGLAGLVLVLLLVAGGLVFYLRSSSDEPRTSGPASATATAIPTTPPTATDTAKTTTVATSTTRRPPTVATATTTTTTTTATTATATTTTPATATAVVAGPRPSIVLGKSTFAAGEPITMRFEPPLFAPPGEELWITIVAPEASESSWAAYDYLKSGTTAHTMKYATPGTWEIRLHDSYPRVTTHLVARARVQITQKDAAP